MNQRAKRAGSGPCSAVWNLGVLAAIATRLTWGIPLGAGDSQDTVLQPGAAQHQNAPCVEHLIDLLERTRTGRVPKGIRSDASGADSRKTDRPGHLELTSDRLQEEGSPVLDDQDTSLGIVYRRASLQPINALPSVTLQISADRVSSDGAVTLTATAADNDGRIARVEFYDGSLKLAQVAAAPYTFVWQHPSAGNHLLIARAVDNLGGSKDSSPRFVTVIGSNNKPPVVSLQLSVDRIAVSEAVTLTATATDPDGSIARVAFFDGSTQLAQAVVAPYTFVWKTAPAGNHLLTARAQDMHGAETTSTPRFLTVTGAIPDPGRRPILRIEPVGNDSVRLRVSAPAGYYIISMSEDMKTWVDIYPVTIEEGGVGTVDDSGGPSHYGNLFYRARRQE